MFAVDVKLLQALAFVLVLVAVDVLLGISLSIKSGTFKLEKLPRFLQTEILPYFLSLTSLVGLAQVKDIQNLGTTALAWAAIVTYISKMVFVDIKQKVVSLFGQLPTEKN